MRRRRFLSLSGLLALPALAVLILSANSSEAASGKIVIGMVEAMSGPFKASGDRFLIGARDAVDEINAKGGLLGKEVILVTEDSGFKPDVAVRKTTKLTIEDNALLTILSLIPCDIETPVSATEIRPECTWSFRQVST